MKTALSYRNKAEELRTLAEDAETQFLKTDLVAIAVQYEALASEADKRRTDAKAIPSLAAVKRDEPTSRANFVFSIERNMLLPVDDPAAYVITVTQTFLPPRHTTRYDPARRGTGNRERSQGVVKGLKAVETELTNCLSGSGLTPILIFRSGTVWVRLERAPASARREKAASASD